MPANVPATRNITPEEIGFIIEHGKKLRNAGVIFSQLHAKSVPESIPANHHYRRLIGSTVVLCKCGQFVITLYREEEAFQRDKRKSKHTTQDQRGTCPYCKAAQAA